MDHSMGLLAMLGVTELIFILICLGVPAVVIATALGVVIWLSVRRNRLAPSNTLGSPPPPPLPSVSVRPPPCPRCGTPRGADSPQGLCPKCVLAAGFDTQPEAASSESSDVRTPAPVPAELQPHFPQLEIQKLIGGGGMGWVYRARQSDLDRDVALKILPPESARDPAFAERFRREARTLARLCHPNIVAIHDFGQAGPYYYLVMEYVEGSNLRELEQSRRLSPAEALAIIPRICEGLQFAHDAGVVHRDVKPENILIDRQGRVKIADFGIAKLMDRKPDVTLTGRQQSLGTPHYMAPEQVGASEHVDHRADIYSLGVVFYEMLTGELPLGRFGPPSQKLPLDTRVDAIVLKSLEPDPQQRYQTAGAVKTDVEAVSRGGPDSSGVAPASEPVF